MCRKTLVVFIVCIFLMGSFTVANTSHTFANIIEPANEITFTFDSPVYSWIPEEIEILKSAINDFYPVIKEVCGNPAFNITVNIIKNPNYADDGLYDRFNNIIILRGADNFSTLCHEIIHAFRDDYIIPISSFEEGMTRAAQIEVFSRLDKTYPNVDSNHSNTYDVYYEALNEQKLGGDIWSGYVSPLLFYQLCGYAWGKAVIENPSFFIDFNRELYRRCKEDISIKDNEDILLDIVEDIQPTIENVPFKTWYKRQGCFNLTPPEGTYIYQRINQFTIDCFKRTANGTITMQPDVNINWYIYDCQDNLLNSGNSITVSNGWCLIENHPIVPENYKGRIKVVAEASSFSNVLTDVSLRASVDEYGVFGILPHSVSGSISLTPYDPQYLPVTVDVVNGAFCAPKLKPVKGTIKAVFYSDRGETFEKIFTKDASDYFLMMAPPAPGEITVNTGSNQVMLSWDAVENAHRYSVKRSTRIDGDYITIAENISETAYVDNVPGDGKIYYYIITSSSAGNEGSESKPVKASFEVEPTPVPTATIIPTSSPTVVPTPTVSAPATEVPIPTRSPKITYGDLDGDGVVTSTDYQYLRRYLLKIISDFPSPDGEKAADVDGSGQIDSTDFTYMKRYLLKIIDTFPADYSFF